MKDVTNVTVSWYTLPTWIAHFALSMIASITAQPQYNQTPSSPEGSHTYSIARPGARCLSRASLTRAG